MGEGARDEVLGGLRGGREWSRGRVGRRRGGLVAERLLGAPQDDPCKSITGIGGRHQGRIGGRAGEVDAAELQVGQARARDGMARIDAQGFLELPSSADEVADLQRVEPRLGVLVARSRRRL